MTRSRTIRWELRRIVLATTMPMFIASGLLIYQIHREGRAVIERDVAATARALMVAVDGDLGSARTAALVLAGSPSIQADDLRAFRAQAMAVLPSIPGNNVALTDASGQQVLNTLAPEGEALPRHGNPELIRRVFTTGKPVQSDIYLGAVRRAPVISTDVPVFRDGKVAYDLSVGIFTERMAAILSRQRLPQGWVAAIFDSRGVIVARNLAADQFAGKTGARKLIDKIAQVPEGIVEIKTLEGIPVSSVFSRSASSGWAVAIGVPTAELNAPQWRSLGWVIAYTLVLLAGGLVGAHFTGARLARAIRGLGSMAPAFARGQPIGLRPLGLREADAVAKSLAEGASLMRERTDERDRELEQRLKVQIERESAEAAARARSAHFAYLSHELRSPLLAIQGCSELIEMRVREMPQGRHIAKYCNRIKSGVDHIVGIINEILDYAKYEAGEMEIHAEPLDVATEIREAVELIEGQARMSDIALRQQITGGLPTLYADRSRLRQILLNLLSNAVKFTQAGGTVTASAAMLDTKQIAISVEDNGIGISADDQHSVMQPFKQSRGAQRKRNKGTGLGLPLTKGLVELQGGTLTLRSTQGVGTVVTVALPVAQDRDGDGHRPSC